MEKILYVEDDLSLIDGLKYTLEKSGYLVDNARTVKEALAFYRQNKYDLLLLDVTLPDGSGFDICKEVRNQSTVPIIFLTASDEEINVVMGLDMGGDDYITKPFKLNELISRIKAILRRSTQFSKADSVLEANGIKVDTAERLVWKSGVLLELTLTGSIDISTNDGNITFESLDVGNTLTLTVKNGDISGMIGGRYEDFVIQSEVKKGDSSLPKHKDIGKKTLKVLCNNGDVDVTFVV